jgi:hypothetical protein
LPQEPDFLGLSKRTDENKKRGMLPFLFLNIFAGAAPHGAHELILY